MAISFQQNNSKHRLFAKENQRLWPLVFLMVFSLVLIRLDARHVHLQSVRYVLSYITAPIQLTVDYPQRVWRFVQSLVSSKHLLMQENVQLRYRQTLLEAKLQHFVALKAENSQLRALLKRSHDDTTKAIAAQILDIEASQVRQVTIVDKGWREGVRVGQAVLDAKGVMGQVVDVGPMTSTVLLISDTKSAVPVRNHRTGEWGILVGTNHASDLILLNLPKTSKTKPGDLLVTSGLGGHYPQGYPVGIVQRLRDMPGEAFIEVSVHPIAKLNQSQLVLVLLRSPHETNIKAQVQGRLYALGILR